jgi:phosphoribosylaminoimidazolecarboxamide formyltransferase / IMP cyclohydrolase
MNLIPIRRALISVSDKTGVVELARELTQWNIEIISTGGTLSVLREAGIPAISVSDVTGFPEILDGRVKTLHPGIHAGLLAKTENPSHTRQLEEHGISAIDLLVVNLYPFRETISRGGISLDDAIEQIDIGGPAMLRAAAKNFHSKTVVVNPAKYADLVSELRNNSGAVEEQTRFALAREVFLHTANYDAVISEYLSRISSNGSPGSLPETFTIDLPREQVLRYGENPHQSAALYGGFSGFFEKLHGKELSYNNIVDIQAAAELVEEFSEPAVAIIKHTNPCGAATAGTLSEAYSSALATDQKSAFGGIVCVNRPLDMETAAKIDTVFTEVIIAPSFNQGVLEFLCRKKDRRLVRQNTPLHAIVNPDIKTVAGGILVQTPDRAVLSPSDLHIVTKRTPLKDEVDGMMFAWKIAKHVKSNAIVYARGGRTLGVGAGQMSRFDSSRLAVMKAAEAGLDLRGSVVASDAFFPFADGLLEAVKVGATAVIQPGGSVRDEEVIRAADEHGIAMVFTGIRHFKH